MVRKCLATGPCNIMGVVLNCFAVRDPSYQQAPAPRVGPGGFVWRRSRKLEGPEDFTNAAGSERRSSWAASSCATPIYSDTRWHVGSLEHFASCFKRRSRRRGCA
jgi:hypothetical protein